MHRASLFSRVAQRQTLVHFPGKASLPTIPSPFLMGEIKTLMIPVKGQLCMTVWKSDFVLLSANGKALRITWEGTAATVSIVQALFVDCTWIFLITRFHVLPNYKFKPAEPFSTPSFGRAIWCFSPRPTKRSMWGSIWAIWNSPMPPRAKG